MTSRLINSDLKSSLEDLFKERVSFGKLERLVYSHDMGIIPEMVKNTISTIPEAVVQPVNSEEISSLVRIAVEYEVPLVPRGGASSGFGGVVPTAGGIVVDLTRMKNIISIDTDSETAEVEPGVVWADLESKLKKEGSMLRLYPSSALASTVGGWVAQGGSGIGSFEYGNFKDNIICVEMVDPKGNLKVLEETDLDLVYSLEGITGLITKIKIKTRKMDKDVPVLAAFTDIPSLQGAFNEIKNSGIRLWSVHMQTPGFVRLSQKATGENKLPEDKYLALFTYPSSRKDEVLPTLDNIIKTNGGKDLGAELALHEWENRLNSMRLKRVGPSLVASELVVPTDSFGDFLKAIENKFNGDFVFEGMMTGTDSLIMMGFMPADERKKNFLLKYSSSIIASDIAKKHRGKLPTSGMYFTDESKELLGESLFNRVVSFKKEKDPMGIMNPGKILPPSVDKKSPIKKLNSSMKKAKKSKAVLNFAGKLIEGKDVEYGLEDKLPEEIGKESYICAQCGSCRNTCTVFEPNPWESNSPRGKWYLLGEYLKGHIDFDEELAEAMYLCTTCKKCDLKCQTNLSNCHHWMSMRPLMGEKGFENTGLGATRENVLNSGNFWGLPQEAMEWATDDIEFADEGPIGYWPGCWASAVTKNMPQNISRILNHAGVEFVNLGDDRDMCCGLYLAFGGYMEDFAQTVAKNIQRIKEKGVKTILFSCPGCFATFTENYPLVAQQLGLEWDVETKHISVLLNELVRDGELEFEKPLDKKVTYHDACHSERWFENYEKPREVLEAIPGLELVEMEHNREDSLCCGIVAAFNDMSTVAYTGQKRINEAIDTKAEYVITNCAGCASQLNFTSNMMQAPVKQKDITDIVAEALDLGAVHDPTETIGQFMQQAIELLKDSHVRRK